MWDRSVVLPVVMVVLACGGEDLTLPNAGERTPTTLTIVSGDGQRATVGEPLSAPLVVQLADSGGHPVQGATVSFRFSGDFPEAAVDPASPATDSLGRAAASARLGTVPGNQPLAAQVVTPGKDLLVMFQLRAVAKPPAGGGDQGGGGSAGPPSGGGSDDPGNGGGGGGGAGNGGGGSGNGSGGGNGGGDGSGGGGGGTGGDGAGGHRDHGNHHGKGNGNGQGNED